MAKASYKDIAHVIAGKISGGSLGASLVTELATYLVVERRVSDLDKIMREVQRIRREQDGLLEVDVLSAHDITNEIEAQVKALFDSKKVIINKETDKSLVGGVKIQAQDTLIDLSVRGQLNQLKSI